MGPYILSVIAIWVPVVAVIIVIAKKHLDSISAEGSPEDMDIQEDEASGETPAGEGCDPADALLDSPYYDRYESLFNYIWAIYHGRGEPQYKFAWLLQSLDMGRELEADGFYVRESVEKDLPYFCETEHEFEMFFKGETPVLRGSVKGILEMISFYLYTEKHPSKLEYWQQRLLELAQNGGLEAQAALCTNSVRHAFSEQELVAFKETYETNLMQLAEAGNRDAQLAVGEFLMQKPSQKVAWLTKAAQQGSSDAWFQLGSTYESMINIDDDGQFKPNRLSDDEVHQLMVKKAECFLNAANANNGIMAAWCQYKVGDYYAEGEFLPKDLQKAAYWLRQAIEHGEDAQSSLDCVLGQIKEGVPVGSEITEIVIGGRLTVTLEEAIRLANDGDIGAMVSLGEYYLDKFESTKDVTAMREAWLWYTKAAGSGHLRSAAQATELCQFIAMPYEKMGAYNRAYECWSQGYDCAMLVWKSSGTPDSVRERLAKRIPRFIYMMGYDLFCEEKYKEAMAYFEMLIEEYEDPKAKVLMGLCYLEIGNHVKEAFPLLRTLENGNINFDNTGVQYWAWMELALMYRAGISGSSDIRASYRCVQEAAKIPGDIGEDARRELEKYKVDSAGQLIYEED